MSFQANDETNLANAQAVADENGRLRAELAQARTERNQWRLRASDYWTLIIRARAERDSLSRLLRGMARRAGHLRAKWHHWGVVNRNEWIDETERLRARLAKAVVLPGDVIEQLVEFWRQGQNGTVLLDDAARALVESWRETNT